jgi:hypothetical protein
MGDVVDYSWARPAPSFLRERGYTGVMRYLSHERGKNLSVAERDALWAVGIAVGLVWESVGSRALGGFEAGASDAREANDQADALAYPRSVPIAYAVDFDPGNRVNQVMDYFLGALSVPGRPVGVYGSYDVLERCATLRFGTRSIECFWQCAGWSGSGTGSGGSIRLDDGSTRRVSRHACLYQDIEGSRLAGTDHNHVLGHVDFLYHPDQQHDAPQEEDDMALPPFKLIFWTRPDSKWAEEVAQLPDDPDHGRAAAFLINDFAGTCKHIRTAEQLNHLHDLRVEDRGFADDWVFEGYELRGPGGPA